MTKIIDMEEYWNNIHTLSEKDKKEYLNIMKEEFKNEQNRKKSIYNSTNSTII